MKSQIYLLFFIFVINLGSGLAQTKEKQKLAILGFEGKGISSSDASILSDRFKMEFYNSPNYKLMNELSLSDSKKNFQEIVCSDPHCLINIGKSIKADIIIGGRIGKIGDTYTIDIYLVDPISEDVIESFSNEYNGNSKGLVALIQNIAEEKFLDKSSDNKATNNSKKGSAYQIEKKEGPGFWTYTAIVVGSSLLGAAVAILINNSTSSSKEKIVLLPGPPDTP